MKLITVLVLLWTFVATADGFVVPTHTRTTTATRMHAVNKLSTPQSTTTTISPLHQKRSTIMKRASMIWKRMDTMSAAGLSSTKSTAFIGFFGHTGIFFASAFLVMALKPKLFPADEEVEQPAGIMNRCPWPFIFFHDVRQGFRDSPTWIVIVWLTLWRGVKFATKAKGLSVA